MRIFTFVLVVVAAITAASCDTSTAPPGTRPGELAQQEAKWEGRNLHDYLFEYHYQLDGTAEAARIYVTSDAVAAVLDLATDSSLSLDPRYDWPTVEGLFARAKKALSSENVDVAVEYDPDIGYPTRIDVSPRAATPAGASSTRTGELKPLVVLTPD